VPLNLVTPEWLLAASSMPHRFYIRKVKRAFDIAASLGFLFFLWPFILLAAFGVLVTSGRPIFYRQERVGHFGRKFTVMKFRTMRHDAEKDGAEWASVKGDSRVTLLGGLMRKYRVDEIPQLINILRGEMSFVGPRPERPEFVDLLNEDLDLNPERLMVQPGLTGWAQVSYPYGASVEDAARKLEYDLYYMKNMSLFLDVFILLDTVRTVLYGGAKSEDALLHNRDLLAALRPGGDVALSSEGQE
jgi:lipopolysaccharide/colanic/teichoic acid biosynthesis glycosyltransferase